MHKLEMWGYLVLLCRPCNVATNVLNYQEKPWLGNNDKLRQFNIFLWGNPYCEEGFQDIGCKEIIIIIMGALG